MSSLKRLLGTGSILAATAVTATLGLAVPAGAAAGAVVKPTYIPLSGPTTHHIDAAGDEVTEIHSQIGLVTVIDFKATRAAAARANTVRPASASGCTSSDITAITDCFGIDGSSTYVDDMNNTVWNYEYNTTARIKDFIKRASDSYVYYTYSSTLAYEKGEEIVVTFDENVSTGSYCGGGENESIGLYTYACESVIK